MRAHAALAWFDMLGPLSTRAHNVIRNSQWSQEKALAATYSDWKRQPNCGNATAQEIIEALNEAGSSVYDADWW